VELYLEKASVSTCENAFYSIPILQKKFGTQRIVVVTSNYDAPRAKLMFEQVFSPNANDAFLPRQKRVSASDFLTMNGTAGFSLNR
jgi:hypothetical protein